MSLNKYVKKIPESEEQSLTEDVMMPTKFLFSTPKLAQDIAKSSQTNNDMISQSNRLEVSSKASN